MTNGQSETGKADAGSMHQVADVLGASAMCWRFSNVIARTNVSLVEGHTLRHREVQRS
jgi:hypothetical protein